MLSPQPAYAACGGYARGETSDYEDKRIKGEMTMTVFNANSVPDYYPTMYLDGYTPAQILLSRRKTMREQLAKSKEPDSFHFTSEIKLR